MSSLTATNEIAVHKTSSDAGLPARGRGGIVGLLPAFLSLVLAGSLPAQLPALGETTSYVTDQAGAGRFALFATGHAAPLVVSSADWPGVVRAARSLGADVGRVTGTEAPLVQAASVGFDAGSPPAVFIGTIGRSPFIDALVKAGKLDVSGVAGKWETFVTQVVADPAPGVKQLLVIAGSDKRGTIYGIYDLSAQIGVSPWYWWADVPARHRSALYVLPGRHTQGEPAVRYRGIFLNDEAPALTGWAREKFGGLNHQFYEHVFELILRLKGNYLWPAMWGNAFNADDTLDPVLADEYGVVMGTSHHEPMLRAQQEWKRFGKGEWNYEHNDSTLRAFWADGIRHMGTHESIVTVGMRGDGDMPMTQGSNIALLERIVADQRKIIEQVTGRPAAETPQLWALYKEVQDYYDKGMRVPDDVTLLFSDDNWGDVRRLPSAKDRNRAGGFGIYYHFDYVGGPRNYKWIDTNPIPRVWEQMRLAHEYGANRIWIVNVGDLKPMEYPISFFLDYAWNPDRITAASLPSYATQWAAQQFGSEHAAEIGRVLATYHEYASRRKPELLDTATYTLVNYDEADRVLADWRALETRAKSLQATLPAADHDAFYELVLHPVEAYANLQDLYSTVAKNRMYAGMMQWRASANELADSARKLFDRDADITRHYNKELAGGKWDHMMDQTHIGYTYWQEPPRNAMPRVDLIQVPEAADMGVAVVERAPARPRMGPGGFTPVPTTLPFDTYARQTYHVDIFNRGRTPFEYAASAGKPWVVVSPAAGRVALQQRVAVSVDWSKAPVGTDTVPITFTGADGGRPSTLLAIVFNPASPRRDQVRGFVESDGYVSIEAEHYSRAVGGAGAGAGASGIQWERIPDFGKTLSGMDVTPVTAPSQTPGGNSPHLEYVVQLFDTGNVKLQAYISPTWDFTGGSGLRYAISFDDEPPRVVNIHADGSSDGKTDGNHAWEQGVANQIKILETEHHIASAGEHVLKYWMVDPGVVLQKLVIDAGGVKPSYLGPPESWRGQEARVSARR